MRRVSDGVFNGGDGASPQEVTQGITSIHPLF